MKIPSKDIPQADTFESVLRTVEGVAHGVTTSQAMAANLGLNDRQGRYYRRAAEILGFVHNVPGRNDSVLTPAGQRFVRADPAERAKMATDAVLNARSIQRVIPFLESKGPRGATRREIEQFITTVAEPTTPDMIHRRLSSIVSWLSAIGILEENEGRISIGGNLPADIPPVKYNAIDEPLSPQHYDLQTYEEVSRRARNTKGYLTVLINEAARERANGAHRTLTNLVAQKIKAAGAIPKYNRYVDMSAQLNGTSYLFEMKSTHDANAHDQVRRAVSQLYEYRYLQNIPDARLVVVIQNPLPQDKSWLIDYVTKDRQMLIAWDGDGDRVYYPTGLGQYLGFLT